MPIEFAPPPVGNLQGFQIPGPQYSDPLQTLAQMQQMKTQRLQQQQAGLQLQQEQMNMQSQQGMMRAYQEAGGDLEKMAQIAPKYGVLPDHLMKIQQTFAEMANKRAQTKLYGSEADKNAMAAQDQEHDLLYQAYQPVFDEKDPAKQQALVGQINQNLTNQGWDPKKLLQYNGPDSVTQAQHAYTTWNGIKARAEEAEKAATTAKTKVETAGLDRQRAIADIQTADMDPQTGTPTPAAWAALKAKYPNVDLPESAPSKQWLDKFVRSGVAPKDQPEYDINQFKKDMGLMGNTEYDQYMAKYAQSLNKKAKDLNFDETRAGTQLYAKDKMDPTLYALAVGQKGMQEQLTKAQLASIPTPENIDSFAQMLVSHRMSPDQLKDLRTRNVNAAQQVITRALQIDPNFSETRAESEYKAMQKTEQDFTSSKDAGLVRSLNNALEHTALLDDARKALNNNDVPLMARVGNFFGVASGGSLQTTYDLIAGKVGDEWAKAFVPGGGGQAERQMSASDFSRDKGDKQIADNIRTAIHLGDSQIRNLQAQYNRGTYGQGTQQLFTEGALAARRRILGEKAPAGGAPTGKALPQGGGKAANAAIIQQFLDANGGNKDATRKALTDNGWTIPQVK
jgi:hypothetical protein